MRFNLVCSSLLVVSMAIIAFEQEFFSTAKACVPSCRSGFTCVDGKCVELCNPPCPAGEKCDNSGNCVSNQPSATINSNPPTPVNATLGSPQQQAPVQQQQNTSPQQGNNVQYQSPANNNYGANSLPANQPGFATKNPSGSSIALGVVGGLGIYGVSQTGFTYTTTSGLVLGGQIEIPFNNYIALRPGIEFVERGATAGESGTDSLGEEINGTATITASYLAIPIDLKVNIPVNAPPFCPYVLVGLNTAVLLRANANGTVNGIAFSNMNYNSYFNPFDFGLDLGAGADFPIGPVIPFVELSYYLGLVNVDSDASDPSATNHGFEIKAGIKFKL